MKIQQVRINLVRLPLEEPLVGAPPMPGMLREFLTVQILTDDGVEGIGVTTFGGKIVRTLKTALEEFGELIKGEDPLRTEQVTAKLRAASAPCGPGGVAALAISAIDIALWDIRGKAFGVPLARLLGGLRDRVPAYASGALTRTTPTDKLERAAAALVEKGYSQIKTQMAVEGLNAAQEVERIRLVRGAVGPNTNLMVDINQRWSVHEAISIGHRVEDLGLGWLEDPTRCDDYQGLAEIARCLGDAHLRRRISLWHRAAPPDDDASLGRYRHDRFATRRRRHAMDEDCRHGGSVQQAGGQPPAAGNPCASRRRRAERAGR